MSSVDRAGVASGVRGDPHWAAEVDALRRRLAQAPNDAASWFTLAQRLKDGRRLDEALDAVGEFLARQPGRLDALLLAASLHEEVGDQPTAAATYRTALAHVRQGAPILQHQRGVIEHAKAVVARNDAALESHLEARLASLRSRFADQSLKRFDRSMKTVLRKRRVYRPMPSFLYFPNIPAVEFFEREEFPWLANIESAAEDIQGELLNVLSEAPDALRPYITTKPTPGVTVQKPAGDGPWRHLQESPRWSSYLFWQEGRPYPENMARCPKTVAALEACPRCDLPRTAPTAMFSLLEPKTRIPPHTGVTNVRLIVHLPLIVPPRCHFRVGAETREWEVGKALIFDDSIEHEAINDSDEMRAVLIFDIWNPFLSDAEREMVRALNDGIGDYYGTLPAYV